jgi:hypothetical protein
VAWAWSTDLSVPLRHMIDSQQHTPDQQPTPPSLLSTLRATSTQSAWQKAGHVLLLCSCVQLTWWLAAGEVADQSLHG